MSFIPFATYPNSFVPLCLYFTDMFLASVTFHVLYFLILREKGEKLRMDARSIVSLTVYLLAAVLGGFCPVAAFAAVTLVSGWWIFAVRKKKKDVSDTPKEE